MHQENFGRRIWNRSLVVWYKHLLTNLLIIYLWLLLPVADMISGLYWKKISRQKVISLWIPSFSKSCFFWCEMVFALRFLYCDISVTDIPCISSLSSSRSFSDTLPGNDKWTVVPNSCRKTRKSHEFMNTPFIFYRCSVWVITCGFLSTHKG